MNISYARLASAFGLSTIVATTTIASAYQGEKLAPQATVTIAQARSTALKLSPGKIVSEELEKEAGGSGLRYTFDIKGARGVREVGIDAKTGKVLENVSDAATPAKPDKDGEDPAK